MTTIPLNRRFYEWREEAIDASAYRSSLGLSDSLLAWSNLHARRRRNRMTWKPFRRGNLFGRARWRTRVSTDVEARSVCHCTGCLGLAAARSDICRCFGAILRFRVLPAPKGLKHDGRSARLRVRRRPRVPKVVPAQPKQTSALTGTQILGWPSIISTLGCSSGGRVRDGAPESNS